MTKLTAEQRDDLQQHANRPVAVVDPDTNDVYFLITKELFERVQSLLDDDSFDVADAYAAQSKVAGAAGWDDPEMDIYDVRPENSDS